MNKTIKTKDLIELLNMHDQIYINPDIKPPITWSTGEIQYRVDYVVSTSLNNQKNKLYSVTEYYQVDRNDKDDEYSLVNDHLNDLKKDLVSKGIDVNLEDSIDNPCLLLILKNNLF
jgi:hypothetical protein